MSHSASGGAVFENRLATPQPVTSRLPAAGWLLAALLLAAALPRGLMAWKVDVICEDGPVYVAAARHLEQGRLNEGFRTGNLGLNTYTIILSWLHRAGLDWVVAGRVWGALMASLVVLPLFGWLRRQFDDRIAALACLLYAAHPTLIERSPEVLRCPTFWFLMTLVIYLLWRAVTEVRMGWFVLAGLTLALAVHTRVEGWFLLVPWLLWSLWRARALKPTSPPEGDSGQELREQRLGDSMRAPPRRRLLAGSLLGLAMVPLLIVLVNVSWLHDHPRWELCFSNRIDMIQQWFFDAPPPAAPVTSTADPLPVTLAADPTPLTVITARDMAKSYVRKLVDAFDPIIGALVLCGLWLGRKLFLRSDHQAMFLMSMVFLAAIGVFLFKIHEVISRYFFPVALISAGFAALGLASTAAALSRITRNKILSTSGWLAVLLAVITTIGWIDALGTNYTSRKQRYTLGNWIRQTVGPRQAIVGSEHRGLMVAYYADGEYEGPHLDDRSVATFCRLVAQRGPAVLLVWGGNRQSAQSSPFYTQIVDAPVETFPYRTVPIDEMPQGCGNVVALLRCDGQPRIAAVPKSETDSKRQ